MPYPLRRLIYQLFLASPPQEQIKGCSICASHMRFHFHSVNSCCGLPAYIFFVCCNFWGKVNKIKINKKKLECYKNAQLVEINTANSLLFLTRSSWCNILQVRSTSSLLRGISGFGVCSSPSRSLSGVSWFSLSQRMPFQDLSDAARKA